MAIGEASIGVILLVSITALEQTPATEQSRLLLVHRFPLHSSRHHLSYDHCLEDKRENYYRNSSVLCCVRHLRYTREQLLKMSVGLGFLSI